MSPFEALPDVKEALLTLQIERANTRNGTAALERLAITSRTSTGARELLGVPEVLRILINTIEIAVNEAIGIAELALRCVGNACIDNDDARSSLQQIGFAWALQCLTCNSNDIKWLTVKVLYNICSDHDGSQQQCYHDNVHYPLIELCTSSRSPHEDDKSLLIDLLFWITGQRAAVSSDGSDQLPVEILTRLLALPCYHASTTDIEDFATLVEICLTFVRAPELQTQIVQARAVACVWQIFVDCEEWVSISGTNSNEADEVLRPLSSSLVWCLSDIAASEHFPQTYNLDDPFVEALCTTICTADQATFTITPAMLDGVELGLALYEDVRADRSRLVEADARHVKNREVAAACQIVGNLIRQLEDENVAALVVNRRMHERPWHMLASARTYEDLDVVHSVAGFLVQLSRPSIEAREIMGQDEHALAALFALCRNESPQLKDDGMRLLRALGKDCSVNQKRFQAVAASITLPEGKHDDDASVATA